jgi:hypothetical protein
VREFSTGTQGIFAPALTHAQGSESKILWTRERCLDIRVSKESLDRAFRIMAAIIAAIEKQGFTVASKRDVKKNRKYRPLPSSTAK